MNFLGIEIGGSKLQLATGSKSGEIFEVARLDVERACGGAAIRNKIQDYITEFKPRFDWQAIGVGFGGPVNWKTGRICQSHQIDGWNEFDLGNWLRDLSRLPVIVDNDSNLAAYAEAVLGAGRNFSRVFYTNSGSGVGAGAVMDGSIYHGALFGEMEFGHLQLDRKGTEIEHRCSGWAVDRRIQAIVATEPHSILAVQVAACGRSPSAALAPSLEKNCPVARQIVEETAEDLAWGLSHVVHLIHPEVIILGGGLAFIGEPWREAIARKLGSFIMPAFLPGPQVRLSHFQDMVVPTGALLSAAAAIRTRQINPEQPREQTMKQWIQDYLKNYERLVATLPGEKIQVLIEIFREAWKNDRRIFVFGNGGSAANASHFVTDLGKGSSDKLEKRFHVLSINDNTPWLTAIGNDYSFEEIYVRQLMNYAQPGDILYTMSVSGNSPNLVKAVQWANERGLETIALVGQKTGKLAGIARHVVVIEDDHYGRVEDAHMTISHMICYAFMEGVSATFS